MSFIFHSESISLKIKRTAFSGARCNFPGCSESKHLKRIPKELRYRIAIEQKVFVPTNSLACAIHISDAEWVDVQSIIVDTNNFTENYLVDMFQLLTNVPKKKCETLEASMSFD